MTFVWPSALWLLGVLPGLAALYLLLPRRRRPRSGRFAASVATARVAMGWRRHVPPVLSMLALGVLIAAIARPAVMVNLSGPRSTIILAMDVSQSMSAEDVQPTRHAASQQAAMQFIAQQPPNVEVGIVAFAGIAFVAQPPTTDHPTLYAAIERLKLLRSTAVGSGIVTSLQTIFPDTDLSNALYGGRALKVNDLTNAAVLEAANAATTGPGTEHVPDPDRLQAGGPGSYESAIIILMTDGATTIGPDPRRAGQLAADLGVRVFTVAFGAEPGSVVDAAAATRADVDEPTLRDIAEKTGADYFAAHSAAELAEIYATMSTRFVRERVAVDLAFVFAGIGALIATVAAFLSLWWFGRVA